MANSLSVNPIRVDTAFGTASTTAPIGWKSQVKSSLGSPIVLTVEKLVWQAPAVVGNVVTIIDPISSIVLAQMTCGAADVQIVQDYNAKPRLWTDFMVSEIDSGVLWIYAKGI